MSYRLIILGVLAEQPHYGYDLKQTIERQHFADYIRLSGGGLYYHLRKLRDEGYIEEQTIEREGNYPDRHIYCITESGRAYLLDLLRTTLDDVRGRRVYDPLDAALSFAFLLPREEVLARLRHQLDTVQGMQAAMEFTQQLHHQVLDRTANQANSAAKSESLYAQLMIDHNIALLRHDVQWLQEAIQRIEENTHFESSGPRHSPTAETDALEREYTVFEQQLSRAKEALAMYHRQVELAWQEYEYATSLPTNVSLEDAYQTYQQRVAQNRRSYEEALQHLRKDNEPGIS